MHAPETRLDGAELEAAWPELAVRGDIHKLGKPFDLDTFELANFNRQAGAMMSTLGRPKVDVLAEMARDINPESS